MIYLNSRPLDLTVFPDQTTQVWKIPEEILQGTFAMIRWEFSNEAEVMHLAQLKHLLDSRNIAAYLKIKYLPYARQDKNVSNTSTFALLTFARILNAMQFKMIIIIDPHSEIALKLINNSVAIHPLDILPKIIKDNNIDLLCYPDKGATTKYKEIYLELQQPYVYGEKIRDQSTGNIVNYKLVGTPINKNVLIVDDICDGGMTFKLLAKDLLAAGAKSVVLFITHGIFSKGLQTLKDSGIQRIFTQDGEAFEDAGRIIYRKI